MEALPDMDNTLMELALQTGMSPAVPEEVTRYAPSPPEKNHGRFKVRPLVSTDNDPCAGDPPPQDRRREERVKKKVSFPEGEALIKGYAHAPNPWYNVTQCTPDNLVAAYMSSCEKHSVKPIQKLVSQLKRIQDFTERAPLLEMRGENVTLKHVETLEEIFKRIQFIVIDLESCHLDDESSNALFDMVEYYESAMQLKVSANKGIGARGWTACARMIRKTPCLDTLEMRGCNFGEQGLPAIGRALRMGAHVSVLHMEDCGLASRGVMILAAALRLCDTVHELYLGDNNLQAADGLQLGNLVRNNHVLHLLDLRNNHLQDTGAAHIFDAMACQATAEQRLARPPLVQQQHQQPVLGRGLRTLVLRNNGLTFHSMPPLAAALTRTATLQTLNLGQNNLTDEGIFALKDGLLQNKSLANLYLPMTKISCEGAVALAEYIADSLNIRHLDLQENDIKTAGLLALSMCVKVQRTVTYIDLDTAPKKESAIKDYASQQRSFLEEIAAQLQHNRQLEADRAARAAAAAAAAALAAAAMDKHLEESDQCVQTQQQQVFESNSCHEDDTAAAADEVAASATGGDAAAEISCKAAYPEVPQSTDSESQTSSNLLYHSSDSHTHCANGADSLRFGSASAQTASAFDYGIVTELSLSRDGAILPELSVYERLASETRLSLNGPVSSVEETVLYDSANMVLDLEVTLINASSVPRDMTRAADYHGSLAGDRAPGWGSGSPAATSALPQSSFVSHSDATLAGNSSVTRHGSGVLLSEAAAAESQAASEPGAACGLDASELESSSGMLPEPHSEHTASRPTVQLPCIGVLPRPASPCPCSESAALDASTTAEQLLQLSTVGDHSNRTGERAAASVSAVPSSAEELLVVAALVPHAEDGRSSDGAIVEAHGSTCSGAAILSTACCDSQAAADSSESATAAGVVHTAAAATAETAAAALWSDPASALPVVPPSGNTASEVSAIRDVPSGDVPTVALSSSSAAGDVSACVTVAAFGDDLAAAETLDLATGDDKTSVVLPLLIATTEAALSATDAPVIAAPAAAEGSSSGCDSSVTVAVAKPCVLGVVRPRPIYVTLGSDGAVIADVASGEAACEPTDDASLGHADPSLLFSTPNAALPVDACPVPVVPAASSGVSDRAFAGVAAADTPLVLSDGDDGAVAEPVPLPGAAGTSACSTPATVSDALAPEAVPGSVGNGPSAESSGDRDHGLSSARGGHDELHRPVIASANSEVGCPWQQQAPEAASFLINAPLSSMPSLVADENAAAAVLSSCTALVIGDGVPLAAAAGLAEMSVLSLKAAALRSLCSDSTRAEDVCEAAPAAANGADIDAGERSRVDAGEHVAACSAPLLPLSPADSATELELQRAAVSASATAAFAAHLVSLDDRP